MLSPLLNEDAPEWPFLALVVSGGHTTLYRCDALGVYTVLAETVDDAAGEAYDKVARLLGLGYPGGPVIDRYAAKGNPAAVEFPRPMAQSMNLSFSGLKTAVRSHLARGEGTLAEDVCASFQAAVVDALVLRVARAVADTGIDRVCLAGGVAANSALRAAIAAIPGVKAYIPPRSRCTDNGSMIANAGRLHLMAGERHSLGLQARPSWQVC